MTAPSLVHTSLFHVGRIELWGCGLGADTPGAPSLPAGFVVERIGTGSAPAAHARLVEAMAATPTAEIDRRLAAGSRAYGVRIDEAVVAYAWVSFGAERVEEIEGAIQMDPGQAYVWDCATAPAWRGRGLYPALLRTVARELSAEGLTWLWIAARVDNAPSLRGFVKADFVPVAEVRYVRLWRWRRLAVRADPAAAPAAVARARLAFGGPRRELARGGQTIPPGEAGAFR